MAFTAACLAAAALAAAAFCAFTAACAFAAAFAAAAFAAAAAFWASCSALVLAAALEAAAALAAATAGETVDGVAFEEVATVAFDVAAVGFEVATVAWVGRADDFEAVVPGVATVGLVAAEVTASTIVAGRPTMLRQGSSLFGPCVAAMK